MTRFPNTTTLITAAILLLGSISAAASTAPAPRAALVEKIIATAEMAVADPRWVAGSEWQDFKAIIRDPATQGLDDDEFRRVFNDASDALPFSHFRLHWQNPPGGGQDREPAITLDWPREGVARLRVRMFEGDPGLFAERMTEVIESGAEALIIDLRGTPGGSFPTAVALSRGLVNEPMDAGAFLTRGWYARHGTAPDAEQYAAIAPVEDLDLAAFVEQLQRDGAARLILPAHEDPVFDGRVVVLTDGATGSTCEPLVYRLQQRGIPVIGERTYGGMLSAEHFPMDETFKLFLPVADYVAPDLVRLDRRGVAPDIEVPAERALERALDMLEASS